MDYHTICAQSELIRLQLINKKIEVARIREKSLFLAFEGDIALKLACIPDMPYLIKIEKRFTPVKKSHEWFAQHLKGRKLIELTVTPGDRVMTFLLNSKVRIIFEMTGRHANIVLVDKKGIILGAMRVVTNKNSGVREVKKGVAYVPPPIREYIDPVLSPLPVREKMLMESDTDIAKTLSTVLGSGSGLFAREALSMAVIVPSTDPKSLTADDVSRLLKSVADLHAFIGKGGDGATVINDSSGLPCDVFPLKIMSSLQDGIPFDDLNEAVYLYARDREFGLELRSLRTFITSYLKREKKSLQRTEEKVLLESGTEGETTLLEHKGNAVLASLHLISKGAKEATIPDPYGDGEILVALDSTLSGPANAERFFIRARKLKAASKLAVKRLAEIALRIAEINDELTLTASLEDLKKLKTIVGKYARKATKGGTAEIELFPRRFTSPTGLEIIVGRSDKENDALLRWAKKNDFWLHAQGVGGSHVILQPPGKEQQPDRRSLELAAAIAAYYSKAKTSAIVPVVCTLAKYVIKRKGQSPGKVTYTREKVIFAEPGVPK